MAERSGRKTELTVVLIAVGLIAVAVVVTGRPLVDAVRSFMLRRDVEAARVMVLTYQSTYHALPGDDVGAVDRWRLRPLAQTVTDDGRILDLGGNGHFDGGFLEPGNENSEGNAAWIDLHAAGLWSEDPARMTPLGLARVPRHRFGGPSGFADGLLGLGSSLCLLDLPATAALRLDRALDDGDPAKGDVRAIVLPPEWQAPIRNESLRGMVLPSDEQTGVLSCVGLMD